MTKPNSNLTSEGERLCKCGCGRVLKWDTKSFYRLACWKRYEDAKCQPKTCACGCGQKLKRNPGEKPSHFNHRKYFNHAHSERATRLDLPDRVCRCGNPITRRRYAESGKLEAPKHFRSRRFCDECMPPRVPITSAKKPFELLLNKPVKAQPRSKPPKGVRTHSKPTESLRSVFRADTKLPDPRRDPYAGYMKGLK